MITARTLSSGVRIVMEEMPQVHSIAIGYWVKTGAVDETSKNTGISHFVEHMMFKGTTSRDARKIASDIDRIGGQINAFTGKEATCYYVKAISDHYREAADVIADMLENSLFEKKELDRERLVICEEIKMSQDDPDDLAHDSLVDILYNGFPLGNNILGTATSLNKITHNVMREYVDSQYTRDSIVISVAGRFDPDDVCDYFDRKLLKLRESKPARKPVTYSYTPGVKSRVRDVMQSHLCLGTKCIPLQDDRAYAFQILNNILGGSMSSRLFQNIREQKGLAYSVFSSMGTFSDDGYFEIYAGVAHDKIRKTIYAVKEELDHLKTQPPTEEEIESSKEQMISGYVFSQESSSSRMMANGKNLLLLNRTYSPDEVIDGYRSVTEEDLEEARKLIFDFSSYSASVVAGSKTDLKKMMKDAAEED